MGRKPKVRPPVKGHPDPRKDTSRGAPEPDPVRKAVAQAAEQLFNERGGARKLRMLKLYDGTLDVYEQDLELAMGREERFKWRVRPAEVIRLRREISTLEAEIEQLREECCRIARQMMEEMVRENQAQPAPQAGQPSRAKTSTRPDPHHAPEARREAAVSGPTGTVQPAAG